MSISGGRSPRHREPDPNSPVSELSSVAKMTPRENQRAQEVVELLSRPNPLFNESSPPDACCNCRRLSLPEIEEDVSTTVRKASPQHKENRTSEYEEYSKGNDWGPTSIQSTNKLSPTHVKQRVLPKRQGLLNSGVMELETKTKNSNEELRDLSPNSLEISIPELQQRIKRILDDDPSSPNPEETAMKALSHLKNVHFPSPPPWSMRGNNRRSAGDRAGETPRTPLLTGRPYDPKQNFLSPRPQFLRYRPNRKLDLLQRTPTAAPDADAVFKVAELNQSGSEGHRAADMVEVANSDHDGISENCNSSLLVAAEVLSGSPSPDSLRINMQIEELENGVPGPLGTVEVAIENTIEEDDTNRQEAANVSRSEDCETGVSGATNNVESSSNKIIEDDSIGIQEATNMPQPQVKDEEGIAGPKCLLLVPQANMDSEAVEENLYEAKTGIQDILDAPSVEVKDKTITNLSNQKKKFPMFVRFLVVAFLVSACAVLVAFVSSSISSVYRRPSDANLLVEPWKISFLMSNPSIHFSTFSMALLGSGYLSAHARTTDAMIPLVEPWQNLSCSSPNAQFSSFDSHFSIKGVDSFEIKTRGAENPKLAIVHPSQPLAEELDLHGSNLQDSSGPGIIVETIEAVLIEHLALVPTSGIVQTGEGDKHGLAHLGKAVMDNNLQDEGALATVGNGIESNFDAGLSSEVPGEGDADNTKCTTPVYMSASGMREDSLAIPSNQRSHVESSEEEMVLKQTEESIGSLHKTVEIEQSIGGITTGSVMSLGDYEGGMYSVPLVELRLPSTIPQFILVGMASAAVAAALAIPLRVMKSHNNRSHKAIHTRKATRSKDVVYNAPEPHITEGIKPKHALEANVVNNNPPQPTARAALKPETEDSILIYEHKIASSRNSLKKSLVECALSRHTMLPIHAHSETTPAMSAPVGSFLPTSHTPAPSYAPSVSYMPSESSVSTASGLTGTSSVADSELSALLDDSQLGSITAYEPILSNEGLEMQQLKLTPVRRSMRIRNKVASPLLAYQIN